MPPFTKVKRHVDCGTAPVARVWLTGVGAAVAVSGVRVVAAATELRSGMARVRCDRELFLSRGMGWPDTSRLALRLFSSEVVVDANRRNWPIRIPPQIGAFYWTVSVTDPELVTW
jgi:hypothetical protein